MRKAKTLIRLGGCPGLSESSLGAQPHCWFCHVAARLLGQMLGEKVMMPCHDSVVSANVPAKQCQNLINSLPDDYSKTGNLMKNLTVDVGIIVVMTVNVDVEDG